MKRNNWFWGIFFVAAAVFVIASQVTSFAAIGFWSIVAAVLLAAVFIQSLIRLNYFGIFLPLALAYLIFQHPLGLIAISGWLLVLAAVLLSIGFSSIFSSRPLWTKHPRRDAGYAHVVGSDDDNNPSVKASFNSICEYFHSNALKTAELSASFASLEVYFDEVQLDPEGAEIYLNCSFGSIELYFPKNWRVVDRLQCSLGGVENDQRRNIPGDDSPRVLLTGNVSFGGVEIHYV